MQVRGEKGRSVWLSERSGVHKVEIRESSVEFATVSASAVVLNDRDLRTRIQAIPDTPGVGRENVKSEHVAAGSVGSDKLGGTLAGEKGGTGSEHLAPGKAIAVMHGRLAGVSRLTLPGAAGGISVDGSLMLVGGGGVDPDGKLFQGAVRRPLMDLRKGAAPSADSAWYFSSTLHWRASDRDGDLRRVAVRYSAEPKTAREILDAPDDWFEADEGGCAQVFVGEGTSESPYYPFYRDRAATLPLRRGASEPMFLVAGRSYRFERALGVSTAHPFWIGGIQAAATAGRSQTSGIQLPGEFLQLDIPPDFSGSIEYFCTQHSSMRRTFQVRGATAPVDGDPVTALSGTFDAFGQAASTARVAAEDSSGNASEVFVAKNALVQTADLVGAVHWRTGTAYIDLAPPVTKFTARLQVDFDGSEGVLFEAGATTTGLALYVHQGAVYLDYGDGSAANASGAEISFPEPAPGRHVVEFAVDTGAGATVCMDGEVMARRSVVVGGTVTGANPGGVGASLSGVRATRGSGNAYSGTIAECAVFPGTFYQFRENATIIGRGTSVPGAVFTESSLVLPGYGAASMFNGTFYPTHTLHGTSHWLQAQLPTAVVVTRYRIWAAADTVYKDAPFDWTLRGSPDGSSWFVVDARVNSPPPDTSGLGITFDTAVSTSHPHGEYVVASPGGFRYYRLNVTRTGGGTSNRSSILKVAEVELIGR